MHGPFKTEALYADGVQMIVSGDFPNGIKFIGTEGWIFVSRGNETVTASDPVAKLKDSQALAASDPKIITSVIGPDEIHLYESTDHHGNWLECVRSRQQPIAPVEVAHRACSACLLHHMAMKTKRKLLWDPVKERFKNDDEANAMLSRPQRPPYTIRRGSDRASVHSESLEDKRARNRLPGAHPRSPMKMTDRETCVRRARVRQPTLGIGAAAQRDRAPPLFRVRLGCDRGAVKRTPSVPRGSSSARRPPRSTSSRCTSPR